MKALLKAVVGSWVLFGLGLGNVTQVQAAEFTFHTYALFYEDLTVVKTKESEKTSYEPLGAVELIALAREDWNGTQMTALGEFDFFVDGHVAPDRVLLRAARGNGKLWIGRLKDLFYMLDGVLNDFFLPFLPGTPRLYNMDYVGGYLNNKIRFDYTFRKGLQLDILGTVGSRSSVNYRGISPRLHWKVNDWLSFRFATEILYETAQDKSLKDDDTEDGEEGSNLSKANAEKAGSGGVIQFHLKNGGFGYNYTEGMEYAEDEFGSKIEDKIRRSRGVFGFWNMAPKHRVGVGHHLTQQFQGNIQRYTQAFAYYQYTIKPPLTFIRVISYFGNHETQDAYTNLNTLRLRFDYFFKG